MPRQDAGRDGVAALLLLVETRRAEATGDALAPTPDSGGSRGPRDIGRPSRGTTCGHNAREDSGFERGRVGEPSREPAEPGPIGRRGATLVPLHLVHRLRAR